MSNEVFDSDYSSLLLREVLDSVETGVMVFNGKVIYCNSAAEKMLGYEAGKLLNKSVKDIFPTDASLLGTCLSDKVNECRIKGDFAFQDSSGSLVFFNSEIKPVKFGEGKYCLIAFNEKEAPAEKEAGKRDDLFRILTENSYAGIYIYKDKYIYANPEYIEKTGYSMDELKDMTPWEIVHEPDRGYVKENVRRRLSGEIFEQKYHERRIITKSGEIKTFRVATNTVIIDGEFAGLGSVVDISDLKKLQDDLEAQVKEETHKRHEQEQLLVQKSKLADMGEMIRSIAHQWKQPLSAVNMLVQDMISTYEEGGLNKEYIYWVHDTAVEQLSYMAETINDFMNFLRPSDEPTVFSLEDALIPALKIFSHQALSNDLIIEMKCAWYDKGDEKHTAIRSVPGSPNISVDCSTCSRSNVLINGYRNEFMQVLLNIFNNSKDAISVARRKKLIEGNGRITISVNDLGGRVAIDIEDNGGGIPEDIQKLVFEPYFTTKDGDNGSGIGLYMVKAIVENSMKGEVRLRNGRTGAVFSIILDRYKDEAEQADA